MELQSMQGLIEKLSPYDKEAIIHVVEVHDKFCEQCRIHEFRNKFNSSKAKLIEEENVCTAKIIDALPQVLVTVTSEAINCNSVVSLSGISACSEKDILCNSKSNTTTPSHESEDTDSCGETQLHMDVDSEETVDKCHENINSSNYQHSVQFDREFPENECRITVGDDISSSSYRTMRWSIQLFKKWLKQKGISPDFEYLAVDKILEYMQQMFSTQGKENLYTANTKKTFRSSIVRYLNGHPYNRRISVEFFKINTDNNNTDKDLNKDPSSPTGIPQDDIKKIYSSGVFGNGEVYSPKSLLYKVWFEITLHFGNFLKRASGKLKREELKIATDEKKRLFCTFCLNEMVGTRWMDAPRIYSTPENPFCPLKSILLYISHLNPKNELLFQQPTKSKFIPQDGEWYTSMKIGQNTLKSMMKVISKSAGLSMKYPNLSVRETAFQVLNESGLWNNDEYRRLWTRRPDYDIATRKEVIFITLQQFIHGENKKIVNAETNCFGLKNDLSASCIQSQQSKEYGEMKQNLTTDISNLKDIKTEPLDYDTDHMQKQALCNLDRKYCDVSQCDDCAAFVESTQARCQNFSDTREGNLVHVTTHQTDVTPSINTSRYVSSEQVQVMKAGKINPTIDNMRTDDSYGSHSKTTEKLTKMTEQKSIATNKLTPSNFSMQTNTIFKSVSDISKLPSCYALMVPTTIWTNNRLDVSKLCCNTIGNVQIVKVLPSDSASTNPHPKMDNKNVSNRRESNTDMKSTDRIPVMSHSSFAVTGVESSMGNEENFGMINKLKLQETLTNANNKTCKVTPMVRPVMSAAAKTAEPNVHMTSFNVSEKNQTMIVPNRQALSSSSSIQMGSSLNPLDCNMAKKQKFVFVNRNAGKNTKANDSHQAGCIDLIVNCTPRAEVAKKLHVEIPHTISDRRVQLNDSSNLIKSSSTVSEQTLLTSNISNNKMNRAQMSNKLKEHHNSWNRPIGQDMDNNTQDYNRSVSSESKKTEDNVTSVGSNIKYGQEAPIIKFDEKTKAWVVQNVNEFLKSVLRTKANNSKTTNIFFNDRETVGEESKTSKCKNTLLKANNSNNHGNEHLIQATLKYDNKGSTSSEQENTQVEIKQSLVTLNESREHKPELLANERQKNCAESCNFVITDVRSIKAECSPGNESGSGRQEVNLSIQRDKYNQSTYSEDSCKASPFSETKTSVCLNETIPEFQQQFSARKEKIAKILRKIKENSKQVEILRSKIAKSKLLDLQSKSVNKKDHKNSINIEDTESIQDINNSDRNCEIDKYFNNTSKDDLICNLDFIDNNKIDDTHSASHRNVQIKVEKKDVSDSKEEKQRHSLTACNPNKSYTKDNNIDKENILNASFEDGNLNAKMNNDMKNVFYNESFLDNSFKKSKTKTWIAGKTYENSESTPLKLSFRKKQGDRYEIVQCKSASEHAIYSPSFTMNQIPGNDEIEESCSEKRKRKNAFPIKFFKDFAQDTFSEKGIFKNNNITLPLKKRKTAETYQMNEGSQHDDEGLSEKEIISDSDCSLTDEPSLMKCVNTTAYKFGDW